jgi:L-alanine-DL-glutamate epimerase-like enolase superfamily enzyme
MRAHVDDLDTNPAAWCATELALLDLMAREHGQTVERFLSLPDLSGGFRYSAVLGDADGAAFKESAERYGRHGFTDFKIKLSGSLDRDREKVAVLRRMGLEPLRVRADANNLWEDRQQAIRFIRDLDFPFWAVEEPIRPNQYTQLARIGDHLNCRIVLDESVLRAEQAAMLPGAPARWLINLRVSKMGGLLRSLDFVDTARQEGIGLVIGAQVGETSLLTRAALTVAHIARDLTLAQEGAFGTFLLDHDMWDPTLMFGAGGVLDVAHFPALREPGFGLTMLRSPASTRSSSVQQDEGAAG